MNHSFKTLHHQAVVGTILLLSLLANTAFAGYTVYDSIDTSQTYNLKNVNSGKLLFVGWDVNKLIQAKWDKDWRANMQGFQFEATESNGVYYIKNSVIGHYLDYDADTDCDSNEGTCTITASDIGHQFDADDEDNRYEFYIVKVDRYARILPVVNIECPLYHDSSQKNVNCCKYDGLYETEDNFCNSNGLDVSWELIVETQAPTSSPTISPTISPTAIVTSSPTTPSFTIYVDDGSDMPSDVPSYAPSVPPVP